MIRPLTSEDIAHIPRLLATEQGPCVEPSPHLRAVIENLMPRLFVDTPHADPEMPGLVSVGDDGALTGMIGRITRRMEFRGRPIRAAVACELFVDPAHRSKMLGVKLLKKVMAGPQDLLFSDIANEASRKIWTGLGGSVASWYGLTWVKVLQPAQFGLALLRDRRFGKLMSLGHPLAALADRAWRPNRNRLTQLGPVPIIESEPLTPELFLEHFPQFSAADELRPIYDRETLDWIWSRLDFMYSGGPSERRLVRSRRGEPLGWYVFQMTDTRIVRVSQIVGLQNSFGLVLDHLLHHAAQRGAVAVSGRVVPRFLREFADRRCLLRPRSAHTLIHARDPELLDAFATGRAFLSLFESEGPLQIWIKSGLAVTQCRNEGVATRGTPHSEIMLEPKQVPFSEQSVCLLER